MTKNKQTINRIKEWPHTEKDTFYVSNKIDACVESSVVNGIDDEKFHYRSPVV